MFSNTCILTFYSGSSPSEFRQCLTSIASQTKKPEAVIIVIDGPISDELKKQLYSILNCAEYKDISITTHHLVQNIGPGGARNAAVELAKTEFISIMDTDDICNIERFAIQIEAFKKNENLDFCGGFIEEFIQSTGDLGNLRKVPLRHEDILSQVKHTCPMNNVTVMGRRTSFLALGGYPVKRTSEDYQLWCKALASGYQFLNLDRVLVYVRFNEISYLKRDGMAVFRDDFLTQKTSRDHGLINYFEFVRNNLIYFIFRLMPVILKKLLYARILRSKK